MKPEWGVHVPLQSDELFSTWLTRAALTQGCDPLVLTREIFGNWRILTIDADRIYNDKRLLPLVEASGIPIAEFHEAGLYTSSLRICGKPPPKAIWPWVLALGIRNTKRTGGLQYCPKCLNEDVYPYFRKHWRFAWHVACEKHKCILLDSCLACKRPIEPHRLEAEDESLKICASCKYDLSTAATATISEEYYAFQKMADLAFLNKGGQFQKQQLETKEWFGLAAFFCTLVRCAHRHQSVMQYEFLRLLSINASRVYPALPGVAIESLHTFHRMVLFADVYKLLTANCEQFHLSIQQSNITRQAFCNKGTLIPRVLSTYYERLPNNSKMYGFKTKRNKNQPRPRHEVIRMMKKLQGKLETKK